MKYLITIAFLLFNYNTYSQIQSNYDLGHKRFSIDTLNGMYNGKCIIWDNRGRKRIEGYYKNNKKTGNWKVWDTAGNVCVKAKYKNTYQLDKLLIYNSEGRKLKRLSESEFQQKRYRDSIENAKKMSERRVRTEYVPSDYYSPKKQLSENFGYQDYVQERNSLGVFDYPYIANNDVVIGAMIFRFVEPSQSNAVLFNNDILLEGVRTYFTATPSPEIYCTLEFTDKMDSLQILAKLEKAKNIIGYKLKEYYYYDKKHLGSSIRVLGLCPVMFNSENQQYEDLFWIYYPAIRETFANYKVNIKGNPEIVTLEDIFHFRQYSGFIYFREHVSEKEEDVDLYKDYSQLKHNSIKFDELLLYLDWVAWQFITR